MVWSNLISTLLMLLVRLVTMKILISPSIVLSIVYPLSALLLNTSP